MKYKIKQPMLKPKYYLLLALLLALTFSSLSFINHKPIKKYVAMHEDKLIVLPHGNDYKKEWAKVDSLDNKGLPKSALEVVKTIYQKAKAEKNTNQIIKSVIYTIKYNTYLVEDDYVIALSELNKMALELESPHKQLVHSMIAEVYWGYYQSNRWKFMNRSATVQFKNDDVRTWDLKKLAEHVTYNYILSLSNDRLTKTISIESYTPILEDKVSIDRKLRPTLYDFLAHRAVDFFMNTEYDVTKPAYTFRIDKPEYLSDVNQFINLNLQNKDSLSTKYFALYIMQDLLGFHLQDKDPEALVDIDLKRLSFVRTHAQFENKDSLYYKTLQTLKNRYESNKVSAQIDYKIALIHTARAALYNPVFSNDYQWENKIALQICDEAIKKFPGSFGANECLSLKNEILNKSLEIKTEEVVLPNKPNKALVSAKNVSSLYLRIIKPGWDFNRKQFDSDEKYMKHILSEKPIYEWEVNLKDEQDFQLHKMEIKLPALDLGYYILIASPTKDFRLVNNIVTYQGIGVSNISFLERQQNYNEQKQEFIVLHRETGEPIKNAKVQIIQREYNYKTYRYESKKAELITTDENGMFNIPSPKSDYRYFSFQIYNGNDRLNTDKEYYHYRNYASNKYDITETHFFTDRAIYRPEQTIYFKGIKISSNAERTNPQLIKNSRVTVTLYDYNSQVVAEQELQTNEYGSFSGSFTAPQGVVTGQMYISDGYGNKYFSVEEYKRPKFEVKFEPVEGTYKLGEKINVKGKAMAYAGSNIDGAKVTYRVVRKTYFPYRWWWGWNYDRWSNNAMEITNGEILTKEDGTFDIDFTAIADKQVPEKYKPSFAFTVYAEVTDINGETHSASTTVNVGYNAMLLSVNIPQDLSQNHRNKFPISATNLNYRPVNVNGRISIYKLKSPTSYFVARKWDQPDKHELSREEYYKLFPNEMYADENNKTKWPKDKKVFEMFFDTKQKDSISLTDLSKWETGEYVMEATCTDSFGEEVKDIRYFNLYAEKSGSMTQMSDWWNTNIKNYCEPGENTQFIIGTKMKNVIALYEIEHRGEIVKREWINLNNEQKLMQIAVEEKHRGNFSAQLVFVRDNRFYNYQHYISVPYTNKQIDIEFSTFRNKLLPGEKEEWKLKLKGKKGEKVAAEMLLAMYDASLDAFAANSFYMHLYGSFYARNSWYANTLFGIRKNHQWNSEWNTYVALPYRYYDKLNWFGYSTYYYNYGGTYKNFKYRSRNGHDDLDYGYVTNSMSEEADSEMKPGNTTRTASPQKESAKSAEAFAVHIPSKDKNQEKFEENEDKNVSSGKGNKKGGDDLSNVKARSNLNETAFFYPHLETDTEGNILVKFTAPEALTRWKIIGIAHTPDLKTGTVEKELITQKELMVLPNMPRFLRENDKIHLVTKISNISEKDLSGTAQLFLFDAISMKPLDEQFANKNAQKTFTVKKSQSVPISWELTIPAGIEAVAYKVVAKAGNFSDGEESVLPVLTNSMLVTESMPLPIRKKGSKTFTFDKLINNQSTTLRHHKLTLEFTSNPAWYAIQALPYMMEYPYECAEQTFSRYYANSIAHHIVNSSPKIKAVFDTWKQTSPEAFLSNLEKNQELKELMLQETPWVLDAKDENERKKRVALLFDLNRMSNELERAINKLQKMQVSNGAWPWFPGMPESRYITQHIATGMGHLDKLGITTVRSNSDVWQMLQKAIKYLDHKLVEDYLYIKRHYKNYKEKQYIGYFEIQYLYMRSYYRDIKIDGTLKEAVQYYRDQATKYWLNFNLYAQGMIALAAHRMEMNKLAADIVKSIREKSITSEEMGMYWKDNVVGYSWYEAPIETHALMIEMFDEVANDNIAVEDLKAWLLKNKQTNDWKTTKATAEACYALLLRGVNQLLDDEPVEIKLGNNIIDPKKSGIKTEAGTGYFKTSWNGNDIKPDMGKVTLTKQKDGVAWGGLYWQYFEQLDKITPHSTPLKINKKLFVVKNSDTGPVITPIGDNTQLQPGDKIRVRIELRVDREMEYVHMKDMRASGLEPVNVFSRYKWQDGLGYYESTKDAATNFFFEYLPKGTHVFEYDLFVTHTGNFSNGITTIQCMYAPEFTSHSEGIRLNIIGK